jgi:phosphate transport system substrate-binding protein
MNKSIAVVCVLAALSGTVGAAEAMVSGAGSTAAAAIYKGWSKDYQKSVGTVVNYDAIGSGAGIKKAIAREVDFGATDVAVPAAELQSKGLVLVPIGVTGLVPVLNLPKAPDAQMRLTGEMLAQIFLGGIAKWNHPEIVKLNPGAASLDQPIKVVVRSDGSGSTYNFAEYLSKVSPEWHKKMGAKTLFTWPENFILAKGSDALVKAVADTKGAIGYVDFSYVKASKLQTALVRNADGEFPAASSDSFRSALMGSDWVATGNFTSALTNKSGKGVWPITMGTYVVLPRVVESAQQGATTIGFITWGFLHGDATVNANSFVRLPDRVQAAAFKAMTDMKDKAGRPLPIKMN